MVSESTVSNAELSEFFGPRRVLERELSELLSAYYLWVKTNSPSSSQNSPSLPQSSLPKQCSRNSIPPVSQNPMTSQFRKGHINSKHPQDNDQVSLGHPAGQTGVSWPVSQGFPVVYDRKTDRRLYFCQDTGWVSREHPGITGIFRIFVLFYLMSLFLCCLTKAWFPRFKVHSYELPDSYCICMICAALPT